MIKGFFILFLLFYCCYGSQLVQIECERLQEFDKPFDVYYDPKHMPVTVLKKVVKECCDNFSCELETAEEKQEVLTKIWEVEVQRMVDNYKTAELPIGASFVFQNDLYDIKKDLSKKNITPEYLKEILLNIPYWSEKVSAPQFDVMHVIKLREYIYMERLYMTLTNDLSKPDIDKLKANLANHAVQNDFAYASVFFSKCGDIFGHNKKHTMSCMQSIMDCYDVDILVTLSKYK